MILDEVHSLVAIYIFGRNKDDKDSGYDMPLTLCN